MAVEWTEQEREAVRDELSGSPIGGGYYTMQVGTDEARDMADRILAALAPFVAAREAQAAAKALREAASAIARETVTCEAAAEDWLRDRADALEAGEDRG